MLSFLVLLIIPVVVLLSFWLIGMFVGKEYKITLEEFFSQFIIQIIIAAVSSMFISCQNTADTEVWNGRIVDKFKENVPCAHTYPCNCREVCSGVGSSRSCYNHCDTCHLHPYDVDWVLRTSNDEKIEINRIDSQGTQQPPRWTRAKIGEATAVTHYYKNYIKNSSGTLFKKQGFITLYKRKLPSYPNKIYDYYHLNRALGFSSEWNSSLEELNADLGAIKEANIILINAGKKPMSYAYAIEEFWAGAKKNDIVTIIGNTKGKISWVYIIAWPKHNIFKIKLRDDILSTEVLNRTKIFKALRINIKKYFERKPMKDFEYLKGSITPTKTQWIISILIGFLSSIGLGIFFWNSDKKIFFRIRR